MIVRGLVWGVVGGWYPQNLVKMFAYEICSDMKNTDIVNLVVQKFDFGGPLWGGSEGKWPSQIMLKYLCVKYLLISKQN